MKIAMLTDTYYNIGGTEQAIKNSASVLRDLGCEVEIFYSDKHYKLRGPFSKLLKFEPDIVHVHTPGPLGHIGVLYGKAREVPVVGYFHSLPDVRFYFTRDIEKKTLGEILWRLTRNFYKGCDLTLVPTREIERLLLSKGFEDLSVIAYGIDLSTFSPGDKDKGLMEGLGLTDGDILLLYTGWFRKDKRVEVLLDALRYLDPEFKLLLVGAGMREKSVRKKAREPGIAGRIFFHPPVPNGELPRFYRTGDIYVNASASETLGISMIEAMACALPIVATASPGAKEIIMDGKNGFLAELNAPESMVEGISKLKSEWERRRMGRAGRSLAEARHDMRDMGKKLLEVYEGLIERTLPSRQRKLKKIEIPLR